MITLGIESTCDETACAIVKGTSEILSNVIASQADLHSTYGGVVPELACRQHVEQLIPTLDQALQIAKTPLSSIDLIGVAYGPGLIGALLIGLNAAKTLSLALKKPLIGINHLEAHLFAALMNHKEPIQFPCIGVVISGGHTALLLMETPGRYQLIGQTIDDAIGEAFDKVAKLLKLPYPGGPEIEKLALKGDPSVYAFRPGVIKGRKFDFSFSGLKTKVLYTLKGQDGKEEPLLTDQIKADIAASFQEAALKDVFDKTLTAAREYGCHTAIFGGGVTNNKKLRSLFEQKAPNLKTFWPNPLLTIDNAAMIAGFAAWRYQMEGAKDDLTLRATTRIPFLPTPN